MAFYLTYDLNHPDIQSIGIYTIYRCTTICTVIFIDPDYHPTKMIEELSIAATVEATMELLEARHRKIPIEAIDPNEFVRAKQKKL